MEAILKVEGLTKSMGKRTIIDNISFEAYAGEVFGFLGPNGAGKTTTIKMIAGLLDQDAGKITVAGHDTRRQFEKAMENIGGVVENPELYKYMTGLQNLRQYQRIRPGVTRARIDEVVEFVGLSKRINEKVRRYSLGMKQRLGVAQAILSRPRLLILDEPTNGLDPAGIKDLRDMLVSLAHEQGVCVFVSSHLLSEMQLMCDRVGIIMNGKIVGVKGVHELVEDANSGHVIYRYTVNDAARALGALADLPRERFAETGPQYFDVIADREEDLREITRRLVEADVLLLGLARKEKSFEDIFIEMTQEGGGQIA